MSKEFQVSPGVDVQSLVILWMGFQGRVSEPAIKGEPCSLRENAQVQLNWNPFWEWKRIGAACG